MFEVFSLEREVEGLSCLEFVCFILREVDRGFLSDYL